MNADAPGFIQIPRTIAETPEYWLGQMDLVTQLQREGLVDAPKALTMIQTIQSRMHMEQHRIIQFRNQLAQSKAA